MSVSACNTSYLASSVNLKTFVRESVVSSESERADHRRELNFRGEEAKIAYDEIVSRPSEKNEFAGKSKNIPKILKPAASECHVQKSSESRKRSGVTANSILRAVESGDVEYLRQNVTQLNVNIRDDYGWTPLMSAAFGGSYKIVDFLLQLGADARYRDKSGFTAAGLASKKNYSGIVALLKEKHSTSESTTKNSVPQKQSKCCRSGSRFYCSVCEESFGDTTVRKHEASTLHIFNSKPKLPAAMYAIPKQNRGYRMLLNGGWREEGLGPEGEGLKYPIKTVLKRDRKGLGQESKDAARVTHFKEGDLRAVERVRRQPNEKTLRKGEREKVLSREARRERAIRRALS